jgi:hypothetical protein
MPKAASRSNEADARQFTRAPLLAPTSFEQAARAVSAALKQRDSRAAEAICIVLAIALSLLSLTNVTQHGAHSWAVHVGPGGSSLTAAGWWCLLFSNPLFFFLLLRRLGRHLVWSRFVEVKRAAQAELQSLHRIRDRMVGNRTRLIW